MREWCRSPSCERFAEPGEALCLFHDAVGEWDASDGIPQVITDGHRGRSKWDGFHLQCGHPTYFRQDQYRRGATRKEHRKPRQPMYGNGGKLAALRAALLGGDGVRAAARIAGCDKNTASKYRRLLMEERGGEPILCACGQPSTHRGWCHERVTRSVARTAFLSSQRWDEARRRGHLNRAANRAAMQRVA